MIPHISRVVIKNYKSIGKAVVDMRPFLIFVGPNGSGKSNLFDSLEFVKDSLTTSVESALSLRGGLAAVRRNSISHPTDITIGAKILLDGESEAVYQFTIKSKKGELYRILYEKCSIRKGLDEYEEGFEIANGEFIKEISGLRPAILSDRLALPVASSIEPYRTVYNFLTSMRFYSLAPQELKKLQEADAGKYLEKDGHNAAAVLKRLLYESERGGDDDSGYMQVCRLLSKVVKGIQEVSRKSLGKYETITFKQNVGSTDPWNFDALSMSDGTLRVLGILLACFQPGIHSVIAMEEPEATVHPAVAELLVEVLKSTSEEKQVLLTTHSPEILDYKNLQQDDVMSVSSDRNNTIIAPLSEANKRAVREKLFSLGDLHRSGELAPDMDLWQKNQQTKLPLI
ncbi:MAG: AAA family ATPase [Pseudomonadota bacterium]